MSVLAPVPEPIEGDDAPDYVWLLANPEALRCFILKHYGAGAFEIDGRILCENMEHVFMWITKGKVPTQRGAKKLVSAEGP